jgi:hypothetical protein
VQKNQFSELNQPLFDFFTINFIIWSHILSTSGDAVRGQNGIAGTTYMLGTTSVMLGKCLNPQKFNGFHERMGEELFKFFEKHVYIPKSVI